MKSIIKTALSARIAILTAVWCVCVMSGWFRLTKYGFSSNIPIQYAQSSTWPKGSTIQCSPDTPTLLVFIHPKCPCTRATIVELHRIFDQLTKTKSPLPDLAIVVNCEPKADDSWLTTPTVLHLMQLPNARLVVDRGGVDAQRFGANTSGTLMLFDPSGHHRWFFGGITISRGHQGDNPGAVQLMSMLKDRSREAAKSCPVYGCGLIVPRQVEIQSIDFPISESEYVSAL